MRTNVSSRTVSMINVAMEADIDKYSHMIIHQRTSDYENYELHFASQYVRTAVVDSLQANAFQEMQLFVKSQIMGSCTAGLRGAFFESIVHHFLPSRDREYMVRKLSDSVETKKIITKCDVKVFDSKIEDLVPPNESVYLRPKSRTFEFADALCPPDYIFQVSVSNYHPIQASGLKRILNKFKEHKDWREGTRISYYFVVPEDVYTHFSRFQNYVGGTKKVIDTKPFDHVDQQWRV